MKSEGRNSPFLVIEDEDVAELVGKPSKMGNRHSEFYFTFILIITPFVSYI